MTNHWVDMVNADVVMIMGGNPAENHPIAMNWIRKTKERGAIVLQVDPRFETIARMARHPGANIPPSDFEVIQASLTMLQCTRCHTEAVLSRLVLQTPAEQVATIRRMQRMPESGMRPDQVPQVVEAFRTLSGQR